MGKNHVCMTLHCFPLHACVINLYRKTCIYGFLTDSPWDLTHLHALPVTTGRGFLQNVLKNWQDLGKDRKVEPKAKLTQLLHACQQQTLGQTQTHTAAGVKVIPKAPCLPQQTLGQTQTLTAGVKVTPRTPCLPTTYPRPNPNPHCWGENTQSSMSATSRP